jgi:hypothetical protein
MINDNTQCIINKKPTIDIKTMVMCSCIKSVLLTEEIYNGRLYHTIDTNEFFFDWGDKRYPLNWLDTSEIKEIDISDVVRFGERISKLNNDVNYINITTLKQWLDDNNYKPYDEKNDLSIDNIDDVNEVITTIQKWISHIVCEIELFKRNDIGEYLDENGSVISDTKNNLDKLVSKNSLLKTDIELLIERNKIYWGGDLDF